VKLFSESPCPAPILNALTQGLRALFSTAPWAAQRLLAFAGQRVALHLAGFVIPLIIEDDGVLALAPTPDAAADLTIRIPLNALPLFGSDEAAALRLVHMEGNSGLAQEVGYLAKHFRPDLEELLSRVIGDIAAHRVAGALRVGGAWALDTAQRFSAAFSEYATEEARWVASRTRLDQFSFDVAQLKDALERLERRVAGLS
jgi:ubiquinone biosynthesis protein UbiJ